MPCHGRATDTLHRYCTRTPRSVGSSKHRATAASRRTAPPAGSAAPADRCSGARAGARLDSRRQTGSLTGKPEHATLDSTRPEAEPAEAQLHVPSSREFLPRRSPGGMLGAGPTCDTAPAAPCAPRKAVHEPWHDDRPVYISLRHACGTSTHGSPTRSACSLLPHHSTLG